MKRLTLIIASAVLAALAVTPVAASTITETYSFTVGDFVNGAGSDKPPLSTLTGTFTLTFDPSLSYTDDTTNIVVRSLNAPVGSAIGFTNFVVATGDVLAIGGIQNGAAILATGTNDVVFFIQFTNPNSPQIPTCSEGISCGNAPGTALAVAYTSSGFPSDAWVATTGSVVASVPEPATWAILLASLLGMGAMLRAARRNASRIAEKSLGRA